MDETRKLLTDIVRHRVLGVEIDLSPLTLDEAKALYSLSKRHELAHIVGDALCHRGLLPNEKAEEVFQKEAFRVAYQYEKLEKELSFLSSLFEEAKIPFMPLKGAVLRPLYPVSWMRNSCDIDVLVHEEDLSRAKELLLSKEYRFFATGGHDVSFDSPRDVHIELHYRLVEKTVLPGMETPLEDPWATARPASEGGFRYVMDDACLYYYHIAHMVKHYLFGGCGIRPYLDLFLLRHRLTCNTDARTALLSSGGLLTFHETAAALADVWFGNGAHTPLTEEMEAHVLKGGVYGSTENRVKVQQIKRGGKVRYALSRIFIPYRSLKHYYPALEKHKWLFPLYTVRRWCRLAFLGGAKHSLHELHLNSSLSAKEKEETLAHLSALGIKFS